MSFNGKYDAILIYILYIKLNLSFSPVTCFLTCLRTVDKLCLVDFLQSSVFVNKFYWNVAILIPSWVIFVSHA